MESPLVLQEQKVNTEAAGDAIVKGSEPKRARVEEKSTRLPCTFTTSSSTARAPSYGSAAAAGADLHASLAASVPAKGKALISTGLHIALPTGHYGRVAPRSGLAAKNFIDVGAGVVDEDYRGELKVVLFNHADTDFAVAEGDRIAQFICEKYIQDFESAPRTEEGSKTTCRFVKLNDRASSPVYSKEGAVGAQLKAAEEAVVPARGKACIGTGLQVELPDEHYGRVASLTDLAEGHGLKAGAGVVDSDYRGELKVLLFNHSDTDFDVTIGTPIAQLVCQHVALLNFAETTELPTTARGAGGFGSTGVAEQKENAPAEKEERTSSLTLLREGARLPVYGSLAAAGADLHANEAAIVPAGGRALIGTGLGLAALPAGYYARVAPRSGLAAKNSIDVGAGVISGDHEGEIKVLLFNYGSTEFAVSMGDRIAQLIYEKTTKLSYEEASSLDETARGEGGFGSTGVSAQ